MIYISNPIKIMYSNVLDFIVYTPLNEVNMISRTRASYKEGRGLTSSLISSAKNILGKLPIGSVINTAIDVIPVELHLPGGYQYCGPGTKLEKRLKRGDPGINELDRACKDHDIAYAKYSDTSNRAKADTSLADQAWRRVISSDATFGERAAALAVSAAMKAKTAIGGGKKKRRGKKPVKKGGNVKRRKNTKKVSTKKKSKGKTSTWTMVKSGKGLYLKPYQQRVY